MRNKKLIIYVIAIVASGAYLGNLLNMGLTYAPYWQSLSSDEFMQDFGIKFYYLLATLPVTMLPAIAAIILAILGQKDAQAKKLWRVALYGTLGGLLISAIYHLPTNFGFLEQTYAAEEVRVRLGWWVILHWGRVALAILTAVYTVLGFRRSVEVDMST
ncbi:MAG: anthrone oxygenase family protein [Bacteroidota bacterium]